MGFNLAQGLHDNAERAPERVALHVEGRSYGYAELRNRVRQVAAWLRAQTGPSGLRVAIFAKRSLDCYLGILGAAWAGGTYVPLNPQLPEERLARMLENARVQAIVADPDHLPLLSAALRGRTPVLCPTLEALPSAPREDLPAPVGEAHVGYIEFTSGTTGFPKGVMVPSRAVRRFLGVNRALLPVGVEDRVAALSDITFDLSVFDMFFAWDRGAALYVVPSTQTLAPLSFIQEHALTVALAVPSVAAILGRMKLLRPGAMPSLRVSLFCGEPLPISLAQAWSEAAPGSVVENYYGPTEATVACSHLRYAGVERTPAARGIMSIGVPFPGTAFAVLGPDLRPVGPHTPGELAISGDQLALGYDGDAEKTRQKFVTLEGERWYLTGDLAQTDEEGRYFHLGRIDNQVKVRGMRVELEEVEAHLRAVCETDEVAAVAWPSKNGSADGVIGFVCAEHLAPRAAELRKALRARLPAYMAPTALHFVSELPLNPNGKVDRKQLAARLEQARR